MISDVISVYLKEDGRSLISSAVIELTSAEKEPYLMQNPYESETMK